MNDRISWKQDTEGWGWHEGRNGEGTISSSNPGLPPSHFFWWGGETVYFPWVRIWRVNQFVTQYIHVHNSVEVVVLFSIGWEEADSGELDIKDDSPNWTDGFIASLVDGCFCMNQLHGVLFPKFILDVETLWFWEK